MAKGSALLTLLFLSSCITPFANEVEFARIQESQINYKDWTFKHWQTGEPTTFSSLSAGKKLVLVVYFAPWCSNWKHELPLVRRLYEKYKHKGLEIVGVNEYGPTKEIRECFGELGVPFTVVVESESRSERNHTTHYDYRTSCNDSRKWGSPWHIFIETGKNPYVGNGEFFEDDVEKFISDRLDRM